MANNTFKREYDRLSHDVATSDVDDDVSTDYCSLLLMKRFPMHINRGGDFLKTVVLRQWES